MSVPKQGRGKRIWLIAMVMVIIAIFGAAVIWRGALSGAAAETYLQRHFGIASTVTVTDIDSTGISLADLTLGSHAEAHFRDIRVDYVTDGLATPVLQHIDIGDATLQIGFDGKLHLGSLDRLLAVQTPPAADGKTSLPIVVLHHLTILLDTPVGRQHVEGMATYDKDTLFTNLNWVEDNNAARFNTTATIHDLSVKPKPEGQFQATITPQSALWQFLPAIPPTAGLISFEAALTSGTDALPAPRLQVGLSAQGVNLPQLPAPIDVHIATSLQSGDDLIQALTAPQKVDVRDLSIDLKGGLSPSFTGALSNGNGSIDLRQARPQLIADVALDLRDQALAIGGMTLKEPTANIKLHVTSDGDTLVATPTDNGKLTLLDIAGAPLTFPSLLTLPIQADGSQLSVSKNRDSGSQLALSLALGDIKAQFLPAGQKTVIGVTANTPKLSFTGGTHTNWAGKLTLAKLQLTRQSLLTLMANLQLDGTAMPDMTSGTANLSISDLEIPNVVAPLRFAGKAKLNGTKADFSSTVSEPKSKTTLSLAGSYDLHRQAGRLHIDLPPVVFAKGSWQPIDFAPQLRGRLQDIAGSLALKGDIDLMADGSLNSDLDLALSNLSGKIGPTVCQNINGVIKIDHPWPLSTAPGQSLAVQQVVLGLPFTNGLIRFDIDDGKTIKIDAGTLSLANGQVTLDPTILSTDAPVQQLNLNVDHLGVNELFKLIGIAGLSGEGDIAGRIPVSLFPEGVVIKDAKLASTGPGKLKYDLALAPAAVKNAGSSVNMALGALSDFHYKELILTLQRQLTGDAELGLHISGSNPSFYNGYPVEFNFTASGRLDEILRQGLAGYQVPDMIEQQLNQFR
jgi:hypothetical protein